MADRTQLVFTALAVIDEAALSALRNALQIEATACPVICPQCMHDGTPLLAVGFDMSSKSIGALNGIVGNLMGDGGGKIL